MAIEVFWGSGSPYSWRVLLALTVKGVPYESRLIQFSKGEHKAPEYLAMNPRGKVPTIRDGDYTLYESMAILRYLEAKHPEPALFGTSPEETGRIECAIQEWEHYARGAAFDIVLPLFFGQADARADGIRAGAEVVHRELGRVDQLLANRAYVAGDSLSAADLLVYPDVQSLQRAAAKEAAAPFELGLLPLAERYPNLAAWCTRIETIEGFEATYPPHWR